MRQRCQSHGNRQLNVPQLMQNSTSSVIDNFQASTRRLNQSTTAARYTKPRAIGM